MLELKKELSVNSDLVKQKIDKIRTEGEIAFRDGKVKLFEGFPSSMRFRVNTSLLTYLPEEGSLPNLICKLANQKGLYPFTASISYHLHMSLLEADSDEIQWPTLRKMWSEMKMLFSEDDELLFEEDRIIFDHVVTNSNGDTLLMASKIPQNIEIIRQRIDRIYQRNGLTVRPVNDIMHMTVQRLRATKESTPNVLREYYEDLRKITSGLSREIAAKTIVIYYGSAADLFNVDAR